MKKQVMAGALAGMLLVSTTVFAASADKQITVTPNQMKVVVNGTNVTADNFLYEGTTYLPLRAVSEALGAQVGYDSTTQTATITGGSASDATSSKELTMNATSADVYYQLLDNEEEAYALVDSLYTLAANSGKDSSSISETQSDITDWLKDVTTFQDDVKNQKDRVAKYKAKDNFYQTSLTEADSVVANLEQIGTDLTAMGKDAQIYVAGATKTNADTMNNDEEQIMTLLHSVYSTCNTQHDKYMTRITE